MKFLTRFTTTQQVVAAAIALVLLGSGASAFWLNHLGDLDTVKTDAGLVPHTFFLRHFSYLFPVLPGLFNNQIRPLWDGLNLSPLPH